MRRSGWAIAARRGPRHRTWCGGVESTTDQSFSITPTMHVEWCIPSPVKCEAAVFRVFRLSVQAAGRAEPSSTMTTRSQVTGYTDAKGYTEYTIKTGGVQTSHRFSDFLALHAELDLPGKPTFPASKRATHGEAASRVSLEEPRCLLTPSPAAPCPS